MRVALSMLLLLLLVGCSSQSERRHPGSSPEHVLEAYTQLGLQYLRAGDTVSAKDALQRALAVSDDHAAAYNALALVFEVEQEYSLAELNFRRALDLAPNAAAFRNNFGAFLYARGRYQDACAELARATEDPFYPRRAQAFENLGRCFRMIERPEAAEHAFERALRIGQERPIALLELTALYLQDRREGQAQQTYDRFAAMVDARQVEHNAQSLWLGIQLARRGGDSSRAATYALLLKNLYPQSLEYQQYKESVQ